SEPGRVGVAVDGDDAEPALARLLDRATLVAPGADEEDGLHCRAIVGAARVALGGGRRQPAGGVPRRNDTLVQRATSQPSRLVKRARSGLPSSVPLTTAVWAPP